MADKPLQLVGNRPTEVEATVVSSGAGNAGDVVALDSGGKLDVSVMPTGIGADVAVIEATEALAAGDYVNIYDATGPKCRKADASTASAGKQAHGFVLEGVTSGGDATIYFEGTNDQMTGLTPGGTYALSHTAPGGVVILASATATPGHILQTVGVAISTTAINTEIARPVIRG